MAVREREKDIREKYQKPFILETLLVCSTVARWWWRRTSDARISLSWEEEHGRKESVGVGIKKK